MMKKLLKPIKSALQLGYRHIDTAAAYKNEVGVGKGIRESGVDEVTFFCDQKFGITIKGMKRP